ncbi:MAG: NAD-dependent epimerase/dehydratase family protein [Candidatus Binatia bacterium]|nr:NAD-dependent epimerase/dehydratase family protein [Candidatus Binatia bacterium]MDG2008362.1 NAD-dependent epimerase/dehydratase family protein [Candidatus Binatia bacterium]
MKNLEKNSGRVVIIGAGWIGGAAAASLVEEGYAVVATTRTGRPRGEPLRPSATYKAFDLARDGVAALAELIEGAHAVIVSWAPGGPDADRRGLYLGGAEVVAQACALAPPARLIYTSSTSALPDQLNQLEELDEDCAEWPTSERGRLQRDAEEVILTGAARANVPVAVLRLAGLYGPGRELGRIYRRDPEAVIPGSGCAPTNLVHRDDVLQAIRAALELPAAWSGVIHVCADDHRTRREIFAEVARHEGRPAPVWELPPEPVSGKSVGNRGLREVLGVSLIHPDHDIGVG